MSKKTIHPPRLGGLIFRLLNRQEDGFALRGDIDEEFEILFRSRGSFQARLWYWRQILKSIPAFLRDLLLFRTGITRSYLKIGWRNIKRHKGFSLLNISGLAVGMACCILIFLWVQSEYSFDRHFDQAENIHLVATRGIYLGQESSGWGSPPAVGPALKAEYPEILNSVRIDNFEPRVVVQMGEKRFFEALKFTDPSFFEIFSFSFLKGDPKSIYSDTHVIVLTESMAGKYFGDQDPIGRILTIENHYDFRVVGVVKDAPYNTNITLQFDFWVPLEFLLEYMKRPEYLTTWSNFAFYTYIQVAGGTDYRALEHKIESRITNTSEENIRRKHTLSLVPLTRISLFSLGEGGRITQVRLFILIALIVLVIAGINFMNLSTARSDRRSREVGLRKVIGARRGQIIQQFFSESILLTLFSMAAALLLVQILLPVFRSLMGRPLTIKALGSGSIIPGLFAFALATGVLAGSYPAFFLSSFQPINTLRKRLSGNRSAGFRNGLVVLQFAISVTLIIAAAVIFSQLRYMGTRDLGFEKEQVLSFRLMGLRGSEKNIKHSYYALKNELLSSPDVINVSMSSHFIGWFGWNNDEGWEWEGKRPDLNLQITMQGVDSDFTETLGIELQEGEFFRQNQAGNSIYVVINETMSRAMGAGLKVGKKISYQGRSMIIQGVVKDFHFKPLNFPIEPLVIFCDPEARRRNYVYVRIRPDNIGKTISFLEGVLKKLNPVYPFEYRFLDDFFGRRYEAQQRFGETVGYFSILAIVISCLGLFGLSAFLAEQKTKEIGIRKVLGATSAGIASRLSAKFIKWVVIANVLAWPAAYYLMTAWLSNFAYRIRLGIGIFAASGALAIIIALLTVGFQSVKAALADPVASLKYE